MTKEELQKRIEKKQNDIQKIQKRIEKWTKSRDSEDQFIKEYGWFNTFEERKDEFKKDWTDDCDSEIRRANSDLMDAQNTLKKYEDQLNSINEFNNSEKIQIIWDFLQKWKQQAYAYYIENAKLYIELSNKENEEWQKYADSDEYKNKVNDYGKYTYKIKSKWLQSYYSPIDSLTKQITISLYRGTIDEKKLNHILDKDVEYKYKDFVNRIQMAAGEIEDVSGLKIASNGAINGIVIGKDHSVKVETILAGGYNTDRIVNVKHGQILHYRVLVHVMR